MATNVYWGVPGALANEANASVLMIGDSWFWYPLDNLAVELAAALPNQTFVAVGSNGADAADWRGKYSKDIDYAFKMYGSGIQMLMLSGGGNDIAGTRDFLKILNDDCSSAQNVGDCYRTAQPDEIIMAVIAAYRSVIVKLRARNATATVVMHNYDHAWPTGLGLFGPSDWLKMPMDKAQVPDVLRRTLFRDLIERLRAAQLALISEPGIGPAVAVKTAGTLPDDKSAWANELHPKPAGFKRLVTKALLPQIKKLGLV